MEFEQQVIDILLQARTDGMTWKELQPIVKKHHGYISGSLSLLHERGSVFRLLNKRNNCQIYVHANYRSHFSDSKRIDKVRKTKAHQILKDLVQAYDDGKNLAPHIAKAKGIL